MSKESWSQGHYVSTNHEPQLRTIYSSCVQWTIVMVKESWSQGHDVEQHSRAELQVQTIYSSYVQWTIVMVKWSWSQGHDVEQHSRAELQVQTIYSSCVQWTIAGSEALPRSRRGHQTNRSTTLSTVSHGPSRYPIVRTSWYRLRSPYASLPANLESVAETWKRLAQSFWAPIASKFF